MYFVFLGSGGNQPGFIPSSHGEHSNAAEYPLGANPRKWKPKIRQAGAEIYKRRRRTKELCMSAWQYVCKSEYMLAGSHPIFGIHGAGPKNIQKKLN